MLNGYWLFCEPNTQIARDPARFDEFVSLFKHACLFQREINLSDLMVVASPNFRRAYHSDVTFKALMHSPWINISFMHRKGGRTGPPMDLLDVQDFHHRNNLYYEEDHRYFEQEGSDTYLRSLQTKTESTLRVRDGTQRDPIFTRRVLEGLDGDYLKTHLGEHQPLFAQITREYQAQHEDPLGAIHFEIGRHPDGRYRFGEPMIWDLFFDALGDRITASQRDDMNHAIWRFYRANLVRAESDLMEVDPIQPPENQFYIEALFGKSLRQMIDEPDEGRYRVYTLSTELDDATLYRNLDLKTIEDLRRRATPMFDAAASRQFPQGLSIEDQKELATRRAADFEAALIEYLHCATRELTQRFSWARKPSLLRRLQIRFGTLIADSVLNDHGRPRPLVTTIVNSAWTAAIGAVSMDTRLQLQFAADPELNGLINFLANFVSSWLPVVESRVAVAVEGAANALSLNALIDPDERKKIGARLVTLPNVDSPGSATLYGSPA